MPNNLCNFILKLIQIYTTYLCTCLCLSVPCDLNPTGQRNVAYYCSSNYKMPLSSAVPKKCIISLWEQRVGTLLSCGMMG